VWWHTPLVPDTQEVEAGGSLELTRFRTAWATQQDLVSKTKQKTLRLFFFFFFFGSTRA
jgi:hypothetical protein